MVYFGQEVGEQANFDSGFGKASRTSIFDYVGVPNHQKWMNNGKFDGGLLSESEKNLRDFYSKLLNFTIKSPALMGKYQEIQTINRQTTPRYDEGLFSFVRWNGEEKLMVIANFSWLTTSNCSIKIPSDVISQWGLSDNTEYKMVDQLYQKSEIILKVKNGIGTAEIEIKPSESFIYKLKL